MFNHKNIKNKSNKSKICFIKKFNSMINSIKKIGLHKFIFIVKKNVLEWIIINKKLNNIS